MNVPGIGKESRAHRKRILVVEDCSSPGHQRLVSEELNSSPEPLQVTLAAGFDQAKSLLASKPRYDMALIQLDMPQQDSFGLLREFRREAPDTPVIMFSDYGDEDLWMDVLNEGASDLVTRPDVVAELRRRI